MDIAFARTRQNIGRPAFVVDPSAVVRDNGRQIDWDALDQTFISNPQIVKLNGAAAAGAVSITVDPLPVELEIGDLLNFGVVEQQTITVGASALAAATSITVTATTVAIADNTLLDFGTNKFARVNGAHAAGVTSITVDAIPTALAGGETAIVDGGQLIAVVDAHADAGDTTVTVEDLPLSLADNAEAIVAGDPIGDEQLIGKALPAGTVMDLLSNGKIVPSSIGTSGVTAYGVLATNASEFSETDAASGYGVLTSGSFYENLLPDNAHASFSTWKTELLARGGFWMFGTYADDTV